jgi:hypothetical protein
VSSCNSPCPVGAECPVCGEKHRYMRPWVMWSGVILGLAALAVLAVRIYGSDWWQYRHGYGSW